MSDRSSDRSASNDHESTWLGTDTSTVVVGVADAGVRRSLESWFDDGAYDVRVASPDDLPPDGDLYVVDTGALRTAAPQIERWKAAASVFTPCLLVAEGSRSERIAASTDEVLDAVDDVLETPLRTPSLKRRVDSLLRARVLAAQLQERSREHERLVELLPIGLFVLDDAGTVTYANEHAGSLVGVDATAVSGTSFSAFVRPADRDALASVLSPDGPSTVTVHFECEHAPEPLDPVDRVVMDASGDRVVELTAGMMADDTTQVLAQDVTDREARVERLHVFERAVGEAGVGVTIADAQADDLPLVYVNDAFCALTGYDQEAVLGRNCRFLQGERTEPAVVDEIRAALEVGAPVSVTIRNYRADGTPFWNGLTITPVTDADGTVTHYLGFQRDVTERRERMRLFEHLHEATERLQGARTPTAVAESAVESLRDILELDVVVCWFPNADRTRLEPVAMAGVDEGLPLEPGSPDWTAFVDGTNVTEVPVTEHGTDAERGLLFSLGEHGVIGAADPDREYTQAVRDAGHALADHVTVALDRAEREAELAATTADLENTLERIKDGFIALDTDCHITFANQQAESLLPYTAAELQGKSLWDAFPDEVGGTFWTEYHEAVATGEPRTFQMHYGELERWFEMTAYPSDDGLTLYFRDVTRERERKRELERYETIVQTAGDPIYTLDEDGYFTSVNDAFLALTGYERDDVVGEPARIILAESDIEACERAIASLLSSGGPDRETVELDVVTRYGDQRRCEIAIAPLPGEVFGGTVGVIRDLTEFKDNEQRLAVLDRVLRHNLRNNLNVVTGRTTALRDHDDENVRESVEAVEEAAADVLDIANKARAFQQALEDAHASRETVGICAVVREVVDDAAAANGDASVARELDVDPSLRVRGNEAVELAVRELVENAVAHNPDVTPSVRVTVTRSGDEVRVVVADDAPHIPEQEVTVLESDVETPLEHASGLGLWLVRWTATTFGGRLAFDTTPGGNLVTFALPVVED
ncbi:PAS domain S-box protein [Halorubellus sp. PRR65]|uniref:PAS domain S-box protein n=1 Tax=Halorubellus sp. PRR65 TaxID=3098148 RepID=UPI002B260708|nr:PAS domain S-box protein [Halorubellus sp. PRR65]